MIEITTKTMGKISVSEKNFIDIPEGLFGFEEYKKYTMVNSEYEPFLWLQSVENQNLAFLIIDPFLICSDYETDIDDDLLSKIGIEKPEDIIVMTIVTVPQDGSSITANFQGPLIINKNNKKCMQVILSDNKWSTKVDIMKNLKSQLEGTKC
jgi:flagellar assembly factor FliW